MGRGPIVFYDGTCAFCQRAVRSLLKRDKKELFLFAPLEGKTAKELLVPSFKRDRLILLERDVDGDQLLYRAKASLRILWLLGGLYRVLGLFSFLPAALLDPLYLLVARHRYKLFKNSPPLTLTEFPGRILP